jgi:hypothetical protein
MQVRRLLHILHHHHRYRSGLQPGELLRQGIDLRPGGGGGGPTVSEHKDVCFIRTATTSCNIHKRQNRPKLETAGFTNTKKNILLNPQRAQKTHQI